MKGKSSTKRDIELLRHIVEGTTDAIYVKDPVGRYLMMNPAGARFLGHSVDEILGRDDGDFFDPETARRVAERDRAILEAGERASYESETLRAGIRRVFVTTKWPWRRDDGEILGLIGISRDITSRKQTEDALQDSEQRYRALVEHSLVGITIVQRGRVVFCNPAMAETMGYGVDEIVRMTDDEVQELLHPEDREHVYAAIRERLRGRNLRDRYTYRVVTKEGAVRWREALATQFTFDGNPAVLVTGIDVTARKAAEQALRTSEARHRTLLAALPDTVFLLDADGVVIDHELESAPAVLTTGSDILGKHYREVLPTKLGYMLHQAIRSTREHGSTQTFECELGMTDRQVFEARVASTQEGQTIMVVRNRTEAVELDDQLRQASKMEAIGQLAGGVAHDFNNLLTVVMGGTEMALAQLDGPHPARQQMHEVAKAAERATALTRQLLAFSRKQLVEPRVLDLNEVVEDAEKMLRRLIEEDIQFVIRGASDLGLVAADPAQLEQVLVNLAVNARDAMPQGGTLEIETANLTREGSAPPGLPQLEPGEYVVLSVRDTGVGMSEEVKKHLFEPFFTTKGPGVGTGLGLATSYGIVERHGGLLAVTSELGEGTCVDIYLPRVAASRSLPSRARPTRLPRGNETILLVEDDDGVRDMMRRTLSGLGYTVLPANGGEQAMRILNQTPEPVELLLTDVVMPGVGGRELAERVVERFPEIKVVFATGYTEDVILQRRLAQHRDVLLRKPFRSETLATTVRQVLDDAKG